MILGYEKYIIKDILKKMLFLILLFAICYQLLFATSYNLLIIQEYNLNDAQMLILQFLIYEILPISIFLYVYRSSIPLSIALPFKKISGKNILFIFALQLLISPLITAINVFSQLFVDNEIAEVMIAFDASGFTILILIGIMTPIIEEILFRGVFASITKEMKLVHGAIISGLIFGLFHGNINQLLYATVIGYYFYFLVKVTGSLWSSILAHMITNIPSVLSILALRSIMTTPEFSDQISATTFDTSVTLLDVLFFSIIAVISMSIFRIVYRYFKEYNSEFNSNSCYYSIM